MALTEQERAELAGLIKSEYNQEVDLSQLNDAEIGDLVTELGAAAAPTQEPSQPVDLGRQVRATTASGINALTLGNLSNLLPEEAAAKLSFLKKQEPAASAVGTAAGTLGTMVYPAGALTKIPALARVLGSSKLAKTAANVAGGAATGAGYGFLTNPEVSGPQLEARTENAKTGAKIGAGAVAIPSLLAGLGKGLYKYPFKKLDVEANIYNAENADAIQQGLKTAKELPSEVLFNKGLTGSGPELLGKIKAGLNKESYPVLQATREELSKVHQYPVVGTKQGALEAFDDPTKRTAVADAINKAKSFSSGVFDKYKPEGWDEKVADYLFKTKAYRAERALLKEAGLPTNIISKPARPQKFMSVPDFNKNMTDIGAAAEDGFTSVSPGETAKQLKSQLAGFYKYISGQEEAAVANKLGPETLDKFKNAKEEVSRMYGIFPELKTIASKEAGAHKITPMEGMFMTNAHTAPYAIAKEGIETLQSPYVATNLGKFLNRTGRSVVAPTNPVPFFLRKNENAQEQ